MKRVIAFSAIGVSTLLGVALIAASAWFVLVIGSDGVAATPLGTVTSTAQARAIVIGVDRVTVQGPLPGLGHLELVASSPDRSALALATGDASEVDAHLEGVAYDAASLDGTTWTTAPVPGGTEVPTWDAREWSRRSVGTAPSLRVSGDELIVLGRADGRRGVTADLAIEWSADRVSGLLPWAFAAGVLLLVAAAVAGTLMARRR